MPHRTATLLSAAVVGVLAGSALTLVPAAPARAEECLTAPKATTPAGGHWRYRVERGTKRQCWYLAETRAAPGASATRETGAPAVASRTVAKPQPTPTAQAGTLADARAEWVAEPAATEPTPDSVWPAPEPSAGAPPATSAATPGAGWALASRWSESAAAPSEPPSAIAAPPQAATPPHETSPDATSPNATSPHATPRHDTSDHAPPSANAAGAPTPSPFGSPWTLIAVVAAALAVAGLVGRLVLRFAAGRPRVDCEEGLHRRAIFDVEIPETPAPPPWLVQPEVTTAPQPGAVALHERDPETDPPPLNWVRVARARSHGEQTSDAIEELLAKVSPRRTA